MKLFMTFETVAAPNICRLCGYCVGLPYSVPGKQCMTLLSYLCYHFCTYIWVCELSYLDISEICGVGKLHLGTFYLTLFIGPNGQFVTRMWAGLTS